MFFAWLYLRGYAPADRRREALRLGAFWVGVCIGLDFVGWVHIPHPWAMTLTEFYVGYQPWISLIYLVILAAPPVVGWCLPAERTGRLGSFHRFQPSERRHRP